MQGNANQSPSLAATAPQTNLCRHVKDSVLPTKIILAFHRWDAKEPPPVPLSPFFDTGIHQQYGPVSKQLISWATAESSYGAEIHKRLEKLCYTFGSRFSGTAALNAAIDWVRQHNPGYCVEYLLGVQCRDSISWSGSPVKVSLPWQLDNRSQKSLVG
jgi:hypothetical protein